MLSNSVNREYSFIFPTKSAVKCKFYHEQCLYLLDPTTVSTSCQVALDPFIFLLELREKIN